MESAACHGDTARMLTFAERVANVRQDLGRSGAVQQQDAVAASYLSKIRNTLSESEHPGRIAVTCSVFHMVYL